MTKDEKDGFVVRDRRFWARTPGEEAVEETAEGQVAAAPPPPVGPSVEQLRTALAELEDAKLRLRRDAERQSELLRARVLEALLPVLDNLERSITAAETTHNVDALLGGVKLVLSQFLSTLSQFGLSRRSSVGQRFDPHVHDAVAVIPVADAAQDGLVLSEVEPAYCVGDRVVRPAKVQVGRSAERPSS